MEYDSYAIGPIVRKLRVDRELTQEKVSELTGLSTSSIQQIEQGGRNITIKTLYQFMEVYQCDANTILNLYIDYPTDKENHYWADFMKDRKNDNNMK